MADPLVRASGGVVVGADGRIAVVHRPRYDDWSLPKGKVDPGETDEQCALREVEEETGLVCTLGAELPSTRYRDHKGRDKVVRYWVMRVEGDTAFVANDEVDLLRWLTAEDATALLSYPHDVDLVRAWASSAGAPDT